MKGSQEGIPGFIMVCGLSVGLITCYTVSEFLENIEMYISINNHIYLWRHNTVEKMKWTVSPD